jgi:iron complex transport system ATP-binding protein
MARQQIVLSTSNLCIGYKQRTLLEHINVHLHKGEVICLIGKNGCGKSTLIRTLCGLQPSLAGNIHINGSSIYQLNHQKKAQLISVVLTDKVQADSLTVFQIVSLGRYPYTNWFGNISEKDKNSIQESIALVHLEHKTHELYAKLSDGEKQRVMIAKALTQDTPVIFLDEPTAHLDLPNRMEIMVLLQKLAKNTEKAILLSTHELDLALQTADRLWLMDDNKIHIGTPEDLVLNGIVEQNFKSTLFHFNRKSGNFCMKYQSNNHFIEIYGDTYLVYWTMRALNRNGISQQKNAQVQLRVEKNKWILEKDTLQNEFSSIESLLEFLKSKNNLYFCKK